MGTRWLFGLILLIFSCTTFAFDEDKLASALGLEVISEGNPYNYLGINKIYANDNLSRQLLIVTDVPGELKEKRLFEQKGFLIYEIPKSDKSYVSMALVGIKAEEIDQALGSSSSVWKTIKRELNPFPSAYASYDCAMAGENSLGNLSQLGTHFGSSVASGAAKCISSFLQGIWDATGGQIKDAYEGLKNLIDDPKGFWNKKVDQFKNIKDFILNFETKMTELMDNIASLPGETKVMLICNFVGSLGTSAAITLLSGGAGTAGLMLRIENFVSKIAGMSKVFSVLNKIGKLKSMPPEFFKKLGSGKISDKVLTNLNTFAKHDLGDVITGAMKCSL